jgi:putative colanic acid biosynthesis acetyltransferase WcaF
MHPIQATPFSGGDNHSDPYLRASFPAKNRLLRLAWSITYVLAFRYSLRPMFGWRAFILRSWGAKIGANSRVYPACKIWAPWNLSCEDTVTIADEAIVYNPAPVHFGSHAIISQQAYICGATHDYDDPAFQFRAEPSSLGAYSWVCARATVLPGVNLGEGAVLALGSVATKDLAPWTVYGGIPARKIKVRMPGRRQ